MALGLSRLKQGFDSGSNVQYLLPATAGLAAEYMHRVQAALYDLLFGHAGLGPVPAPIVEAAFVDCPHPRTIVGISIVSQAASRTGRPEGATIAVAMKTDVETGRVSGRLGFLRNGVMDRAGKFEALSKTLVAVAASGLTSLGEKQPDRRVNFLVLRTPRGGRGRRRRSARFGFGRFHFRAVVVAVALRREHLLGDLPRRYRREASGVMEGAALRTGEGRVCRGGLPYLPKGKWTPVTRDGQLLAENPVEEVYATAGSGWSKASPKGTHGPDTISRRTVSTCETVALGASRSIAAKPVSRSCGRRRITGTFRVRRRPSRSRGFVRSGTATRNPVSAFWQSTGGFHARPSRCRSTAASASWTATTGVLRHLHAEHDRCGSRKEQSATTGGRAGSMDSQAPGRRNVGS